MLNVSYSKKGLKVYHKKPELSKDGFDNKVKLKFLNANLLVGFDICACADSTAGPRYLNCFNDGIVVYTEDGSEFAL